MNQIKSFSDLAITPPDPKGFIGEKIKINKVLSKEIEIHDFNIEPSKFEGERLALQIVFAGEQRVMWTSSKMLKETMKVVGKARLPIKTTIIKNENDRYQFT